MGRRREWMETINTEPAARITRESQRSVTVAMGEYDQANYRSQQTHDVEHVRYENEGFLLSVTEVELSIHSPSEGGELQSD
jgi:hypothetical protein